MRPAWRSRIRRTDGGWHSRASCRMICSACWTSCARNFRLQPPSRRRRFGEPAAARVRDDRAEAGFQISDLIGRFADCCGGGSMPIVYRSRVFSIEEERRRYPDGSEHDVTIIRHRPSVILIPFDDDGHVVLVRQYRAPLDRLTWEVPAGNVEPGETPEAAAAREAEE